MPPALRAILIWLCLAAPASADTLNMALQPSGLTLTYCNAAEQISVPVSRDMAAAGITVSVEIEVGVAERLTVTPRDPMVIAEPPYSEVPDGDCADVLIIPPGF